jgi:hypothetical protein
MSNLFQHLIQKILEDNSAAAGGSFGPNDAYANPDNLSTGASMAITGKTAVSGSRKAKKKNKTPLIRRKLPTTGGL